MSDSLQPHGLQQARISCPSPTTGACSNSSVGDAIQLSHPLLLPSPLAFNFSHISVFSNKSVYRIRWPNYRSFSFTISTSNECSGLISIRIDWFALLAVQGTLKSLIHHHSLKASILRCSTFLMVSISYPYMTNGKIITLTIQTFVGKVMSLLFICCLGLSQLSFQEQTS